VKAFCTGEQSASDAAAAFLAKDVDLVSPPLHVYGKAGVVERITGHWPGMGMYQTGVWDEPTIDADVVKMSAVLAPDLPAKAVSIELTFSADDKITHVEQKISRAPAPTTELKLTDELRALVDNSLRDDCPMVVGYMGQDGQPQLSLRGSIQAISDTQLAFWVRNPNGGIVKALEYNPRITLLYRDTPNRINMLFQGTGRIATDEATRSRVFDSMPQIEKDHDEPRKGACMVIELTSVSGATLTGPVKMAAAVAEVK
jgi:hypothetical protein